VRANTSSSPYLAIINTDIILFPDLLEAIRSIFCIVKQQFVLNWASAGT
jgi:hypothetical protein